MEDILFLSVFTRGMRDLAVNHLLSLKRVGITNTLSFCSDKETVEILNKRGFKALANPSSINKDIFTVNEPEFNEFSYFKYVILVNLLKKHKYIWYLDVDTFITKDIRKFVNSDYDIQITDDINQLSTSCMLFKNSDCTIQLLTKMWEERNNKYCDQIKFNILLRKGVIPIKGYTLPIAEFRPGLLYFKEQYLITLSENVKKLRKLFFLNNKSVMIPCLVHANYIIDLNKKIIALKSNKFWLIR